MPSILVPFFLLYQYYNSFYLSLILPSILVLLFCHELEFLHVVLSQFEHVLVNPGQLSWSFVVMNPGQLSVPFMVVNPGQLSWSFVVVNPGQLVSKEENSLWPTSTIPSRSQGNKGILCTLVLTLCILECIRVTCIYYVW